VGLFYLFQVPEARHNGALSGFFPMAPILLSGVCARVKRADAELLAFLANGQRFNEVDVAHS
jgi:hypothetical protein